MSIALFRSLRISSHVIKLSVTCDLSKNYTHPPKTMATLKDVPKVDIDSKGVFKYILLNVHDQTKKEEEPVTIVRGYARCNYHSDIYEEVQETLKSFDCEPIGGGRISHDPQNKVLRIYGYSQGYGKADHEVAAKLIKQKFPEYKITISDEGY